VPKEVKPYLLDHSRHNCNMIHQTLQQLCHEAQCESVGSAQCPTEHVTGNFHFITHTS